MPLKLIAAVILGTISSIPLGISHLQVVNAFVPNKTTSTKRTRQCTSLGSRSSITDNDEEEWRSFRARLIQYGLPTLGEDISSSRATTNKRYAHLSPLIEVGSILLSIPTPDLCQALDQQYWHRCVVLITEVCGFPNIGEKEDLVPQEQLANGKGRGRWSYRGLLLNRCTDLMLGNVDERGNLATVAVNGEIDDSNAWRIQRGGDLLGLDSASGTRFTCLHHLGTSDPSISSISTKLVGNLCECTIADARRLCSEFPEKYKPSDFMTFGGFASWRPGQLEREMGEEREEWLVMSVDGGSIWEELQGHRCESSGALSKDNLSQQAERTEADTLLEVGTNMWRAFLKMIDVSESEATERIKSGQLSFYDQMLKVWAEDYMTTMKNSSGAMPDSSMLNDSSTQIGPGTLVRAKCPPTNDMLLYDAEFLRCLVLVLEDTPDSTVGVILNHPMPAAVDCVEDEEPLVLRYGGPVDVPSWMDGSYRYDVEDDDQSDDVLGDEMYEGFRNYQNNYASFEDTDFGDADYDSDESYEEDIDDSSFLWLHRNAKLGAFGPTGGTRLGTSSVWVIKEDDALLALQSGELPLEDVMAFTGVCIWEKGPDLGQCHGGLREQIDALGSLEVVQACGHNNGEIENVWEILSNQQQVLTKDTLDININAAIEAWSSCSREYSRVSPSESRANLSDSALKAWVAINLLEEPVGTLVEVKNEQSRDKLLEQ